MFHKALVVKVVGDLVTFSVRTDDSRVDVYTFHIDAFRDVIANVKVEGRAVHVYVPASSNHTTVHSVFTPDFDVMVAEFNALVGGN